MNNAMMSCKLLQVTKIDSHVQGVIAISGKRFKLKFIVFILIVLKQTIPHKKALDVSFNLTP